MTEKEQELIKIINDMLPMVEVAFYDNHSAGILPGAGYNYRVFHMASKKWGWRDTKEFKEWRDKVEKLIKE